MGAFAIRANDDVAVLFCSATPDLLLRGTAYIISLSDYLGNNYATPSFTDVDPVDLGSLVTSENLYLHSRKEIADYLSRKMEFNALSLRTAVPLYGEGTLEKGTKMSSH
jgi:hypothetical protein